MEENKKGGYSAEGRSFRPRRSGSSDDRRSFGDRKPFGERKSFGESRKPFGERRSFGEGRQGGERRSFGEGRQGGERRSFGEGRPFGERKSFGEGRKPFGERRSFGEGRQGGERRSFGEGRPFGERNSFGEGRKPFGQRRSFGEGRNFQDRKPFGRGGRNFGGGFRKDRYTFNENEDSGINKMISARPLVSDMQFSDNDTAPSMIKEEMRLNKYIANSGVCSRREADQYIEAGVVTVNGEVVTELGTKVNVLKDEIRFNGERLKGEEKVYIVMNKPKGYVTTASDPHAEKTVMDFLKNCQYRVFPVGRLDKNTTGVLMFTNDGDISEKLTHPSYDKKKIYQVILDRNLEKEDFDKIVEGITLSDGPIKADELQYIDAEDRKKLGIEIHSGKNRIVRRIFESLGYDVKALDRVYFAGLTKKGLKKGEWRFLTEGETNVLRMGAYV